MRSRGREAWDTATEEDKVSVTEHRERPHSAVTYWMLPHSWQGGSSLLPIQRADQCWRGLLTHGRPSSGHYTESECGDVSHGTHNHLLLTHVS